MARKEPPTAGPLPGGAHTGLPAWAVEPVARVAEVFAGLAAPAEEQGCRYCYTEDEIALLRRPDVPLPDGLVGSVMREVPDHWLDQTAVLRRALPQFVALLARGEFNGFEMEGSKLIQAGFWDWPREQTEAVMGFFDVLWRAALRETPPPMDAWELLASCAVVSGSFTPWLRRWAAELGSPVADQRLCEVLERHQDRLLRDEEVCGWWATERYGPEPTAEVRDWFAVHGAAVLDARGYDAWADRIRALDLPLWARPEL
ncbi:hypothetical protein ACH4GP_25590 [Streptomyces celluloflavus]|uniref:Uncharacterized protein n=1 Tax=Streptomyces celluloflavus TaxID=58344 RepID=A0ABW7RI22_9ACTN